MKHQTLDELQRVAAVHAEATAPRELTRAERLERWADLLEADPDRRLNTLPGTEYEPEEVEIKIESPDDGSDQVLRLFQAFQPHLLPVDEHLVLKTPLAKARYQPQVMPSACL